MLAIHIFVYIKQDHQCSCKIISAVIIIKCDLKNKCKLLEKQSTLHVFML